MNVWWNVDFTWKEKSTWEKKSTWKEKLTWINCIKDPFLLWVRDRLLSKIESTLNLQPWNPSTLDNFETHWNQYSKWEGSKN